MDPFLKSVEVTFLRHGIEAILDPDGVAVPVRLLPMLADDIADFGTMQIQDAGGTFEIRAADFAGYGKGAVLDIAGERRKVQHSRVRDPRRYKVQLNTVTI